jgi:Putative prokaryotic signal transducing protein
LSGEPPDPWDGDPLRQRARKVRPQYADGPLVRVARARHQAEAEMIENLLLDQGIPALAKRSGGFDVPDFLAAGPRDILVPASGAEAAREVLGVEGEQEAPRSTVHGTPAWVRALAVALAVLLLVVIAAFVITAIVN